MNRHSEFRCELHHPTFTVGGKLTEPRAKDIPQQVEPSASFHIEAGVAGKLALLHQRNRFSQPIQPLDMREQYGDSTTSLGRSV